MEGMIELTKKKAKMLCKRITDNSEDGLYQIDKEDCVAISTILCHIDLLENHIREMSIDKERLRGLISMLEQNTKKELKKKDKIIDKMAMYIGIAAYEYIIKKLKPDDVNYYGTEYCIKQYFKNKVEGE